MSTKMTTSEREDFLADVHVGILGITTDSGPLAVPIWYDYSPGGEITVITSADSIKGRALDATGRFSLCTQTETLPYKYVTVEGSVVSSEPCPEDIVHAMAYRYLGPEMGDAYVAAAAAENSGNLYRLTPERWYTVDYAKSFG